MFLISYYLERGYDIQKLCNLTNAEKIFMKSSAMYWLECEQAKMKLWTQMFGVKI